ncbi:cyclic GMP-AMP synthase isoform X2 [Ictalurus punctatus]|uniref:Cyclic GMP-AMP synthase isoform X2 n=1 Tax=Ictalurus punctatus TaxID=7998 RepID=A0A979ESG0_ICTPU|nr:cyclic GMP-AMP synthase isoform X2 [Ictalurus punctatus]
MSVRAKPRKVQDENPGAFVAKSLPTTRKMSAPRNEEDKKSTDAKARCPSKLQGSQDARPSKSTRDANSTKEPETPKRTKSGENKGASCCPVRRDNSIKENPRRDLQSAPEKVKKSQRSESAKTMDTKVSRPPKPREVQEVCSTRRDTNNTKEAQAPKTAKSVEKETAPICSARRGSSIDENPSKVLQTALEKLKVKKNQRSESAKCVNNIQNRVTEYVKLHLDWCKDISVLKTGSYYENVKIYEPDEFDVMMTVRVDRVKLLPFSEDGAFYSVEMKRQSSRHPLEKFVNEERTIMASKMLDDFREKVKEAVKELQNVSLERKKTGCPAVTLLVNEKGKQISIDFVLGLEVHTSWPSFTQGGFSIENWLSKKVKQDQKGKPFYLVPKYEGRGSAEQDGIMAKNAWRISFSHVEKYILKNHGNSKTCCEGGQKCCRKQCLKLLKCLLQRLKEAHPEDADKLCSYHAKTTLLHACAARVKDSEWESSELNHCFQQLLGDFEENLRACQLSNFFIPSQNLFKGVSSPSLKTCTVG